TTARCYPARVPNANPASLPPAFSRRTRPCSSTCLPTASSAPPDSSPFFRMTSSCPAWPCSLKANAKDSVPPTPLRSSTSASSDIFSCSNSIVNMEAQDSKATSPAPNATMSAPTKSFARSSVTASSIRTPRSTSSRRSSAKPASRSALVVSSASSRSTAFKKKLYRYRPNPESTVEAQTTKKRTKPIPCDPRSIETGVRQFLADKVTGNLAGLWLLVPELLRLGAWDLVCGWTMKRPECVEPRLALQLINEAALCITGLRLRRGLNQQIFELVNGLPFLASDMAVHELLGARTVADSQRLQVALGKVRRASGHFQGRVLAIDPHRVRSFSKRHMRRHRLDEAVRPTKTAQTFFVLDADTDQPVCFTTGTSARTASNAAEELLRLAADILDTQPGQTLVLAWIPMQKKKPNNSPDFLPYFGYNCVSIVVLLVYQYTVFHAVRSPIHLH